MLIAPTVWVSLDNRTLGQEIIMDKINTMNMEEVIEFIKTGKNDLLEQKLNDNPLLADSKTEQGISLLQFAAYCRNNFAIDILKKHKQKLDIFEAACVGDNETVNQLLNDKPELLNSFSSDGFTALGLAAFFGHLPLVKLLLDNGANPNIASNNQFKVAPIHSACAFSHIDIAEVLIKYGSDVNAKQMQGVTPLHSAAHNGQTKLSKLLIDNGADVNSKMDNGQTPLFMANEKNFQETAKLITKHGGH
jgi:ankyrin repeat protein